MIEPVTIDQLRELEDAARAFYASSAALRTFNLARFVEVWTILLSGGRAAIFAERRGAVVGAIGGILHPDLYDPSREVADEFFWFVLPEHRGAGVALYRAFERWARERGAHQIQMCHLTDVMPAKVSRFYERAGFQPIETRYAKELAR